MLCARPDEWLWGLHSHPCRPPTPWRLFEAWFGCGLGPQRCVCVCGGCSSQIIDMLELDEVANALVMTLSVGEMKRYTIGVELVTNPSVLFLGASACEPLSRGSVTG